MADAFKGFNCVNPLLQINRSSLIVIRQARAIFSSNDLQFSVLNEHAFIFLMSGTGIAISIGAAPELPGAGGAEESIKMKWLKTLKRKITALKSAQTDDAGRWETAAMVYGGDIYAVLVRDRAVRQLARVDSGRVDYRRDAGWPFIR